MMQASEANLVRVAALEAAEREIEGLRRDLESVTNSASWRLTTPLRRLKGLLARS